MVLDHSSHGFCVQVVVLLRSTLTTKPLMRPLADNMVCQCLYSSQHALICLLCLKTVIEAGDVRVKRTGWIANEKLFQSEAPPRLTKVQAHHIWSNPLRKFC